MSLLAVSVVAAQLAFTSVSASDRETVDRYLDGDAAVDRAALTATLRAQGPAGLATALAAVARHPPSTTADALVDGVAGQLHARDVGAFWYTDLDAALAAARREHKPVLSLRLLGRLDEELSCANSRFFRSLVYPDPAVARLLRERFVLHWQTVRAVPVVTIDMGDGRKLVSTVTGNSAHFVLDAAGAVVDVIPGLYDAQSFAQQLTDALALAALPPRKRAAAHEAAVTAIEEQFRAQLSGAIAALPAIDPAANAPASAPVLLLPRMTQTPSPPLIIVPALDVSTFAVTKGLPERVLLQKLAPRLPTHDEYAALFRGRAVAHAALMHLAPAAERIFRTQLAPGVDVDRARTKTLVAMATDDLQNELLFHRALHRWIANGATDAPSLQRRLYDELFETPDADPWIGLVPDDVYTGVAGGGVSAP